MRLVNNFGFGFSGSGTGSSSCGSADIMNKKLFILFFILSVILSNTFSSEVLRPHGVSLSRKPLYDPERNFTCFDNSKTIPFSQVNDDYCDCPDASDEPGTSACAHGSFYCSNAGHKPFNLISSRVNDGICDCCDGSDEYANTRIHCPNICLQLGQYAREEALRLAELLKVGKQLRAQLSEQGTQLKQEKRNKLIDLQKSKEEAEKLKAEKMLIKDDIENVEKQVLEKFKQIEEEEKQREAEAEAAKNREEAVETFQKFDSNQDGQVTLVELQTRQTFDKDKNGEVSDEEARYFLNNLDSVDLETFINEAWSNIKPYLMMDAGVFKGPEAAHEEGAEEEEGEEEEEEAQEGDLEGEHEGEGEGEEETYHSNNNSRKIIEYDPESQKIVDEANAARNDFNQADKALQDIDNEINKIQQYLEKDYGSDEEFAPLEGQCFDYTDHEYVYKLCPFERTTQQSLSGGADTKLGVWGRWSGNEPNKYEAMVYDRGQSCWNGPQRSTHVKISCGIDNKVTSVSEPNRCEYLFEFTTPAACKELPLDSNEDFHDEL